MSLQKLRFFGQQLKLKNELKPPLRHIV